jgi:hypothetical protein
MKIFAQVTRNEDLRHGKQVEINPIIEMLIRNAQSRGVRILLFRSAAEKKRALVRMV